MVVFELILFANHLLKKTKRWIVRYHSLRTENRLLRGANRKTSMLPIQYFLTVWLYFRFDVSTSFTSTKRLDTSAIIGRQAWTRRTTTRPTLAWSMSTNNMGGFPDKWCGLSPKSFWSYPLPMHCYAHQMSSSLTELALSLWDIMISRTWSTIFTSCRASHPVSILAACNTPNSDLFLAINYFILNRKFQVTACKKGSVPDSRNDLYYNKRNLTSEKADFSNSSGTVPARSSFSGKLAWLFSSRSRLAQLQPFDLSDRSKTVYHLKVFFHCASTEQLTSSLHLFWADFLTVVPSPQQQLFQIFGISHYLRGYGCENNDTFCIFIEFNYWIVICHQSELWTIL